MSLSGRSVGVLAYPGYQELEFWYPVLRAREDGASVTVIAADAGGCESNLGYPVVGDAAADDVDPGSLDALIVPGTVGGTPAASDAQKALLKAAAAAGRPVYAIGTGAVLVKEVLGETGDRVLTDADALPALAQRLSDDLAAAE